MGIILSFPAQAASRRPGAVTDAPRKTRRKMKSNVIILPVVRIERHADDGCGPEQGNATGRGRRRRARS